MEEPENRTILPVISFPLAQHTPETLANLIGATILNGASSMEVLNIGPSITSIHANAFGGTPEGMIINLPVSEGAISGAPWGAPNAIINYDTPYAGTVPIPQT